MLHTGASGATVPPAIPVPIHQTSGGTCDAGVDACSAQGADPEGTCDPGLTACPGAGAGYCFDLQASPEHCGTCDNACALGSPCENGQCRVVHCTSTMSTRSLPFDGQRYAGYGVAPTDCDRDGYLDVLAFGPPIASNQSKSVGVLRGNGDGTLVAGERYSIDTPYWQDYSIQVADLNRDQIPDLVIMIPLTDVTVAAVARRSKIIVRLGDGHCAFGSEIGLDADGDFSHIVVGDLDGDEIPDLVASASERLGTFHGNGDGSFSNRQDFAVGGIPRQIAVTDWNSDGIPDVVASDDYLHLLLGIGGGRFAPAIDCALAVSSLVIADFDEDGLVDLASNGDVLLGMHECNFTRQITYTKDRYAVPMTAGDFNGDGATDLVVASGNEIGLVPGDGQGNFGTAVPFGDLGSGPTVDSVIGYAGDFDGDGRLDLLAGSVEVYTLVNTCQ